MDRLLLWLTFLLLGIGIVSVYDASYALAVEKLHGDSFKYARQQAFGGLIGLGALWGASRMRYWLWKRTAVVLLAVVVFMLLAVLVPHVGIVVNGARRWLGHGGLRFQPSEVAKLVLVLYLARVLAGNLKIKTQPKEGLVPPLAVTLLLAALIAKEPDPRHGDGAGSDRSDYAVRGRGAARAYRRADWGGSGGHLAVCGF